MIKTNYYDQIKEKIINNEIYSRVKDYSKERHTLITHYEVGRLLLEAGSAYGEDIIGNYSNKLTAEVDKKYNPRTLRRMRQLYQFFEKQKWSPAGTKLSISHIRQLFSLTDNNEINYYAKQIEKRNLSKRQLEEIIKNKEYERLPEDTKNKLKTKEKIENLPPAVAKLPWSHNYTLIEKVKDIEKRIWYGEKCYENGWSKDVLIHQIDSNLYLRQNKVKKLNNFDKKLSALNSELAKEMMKDPYIFELTNVNENIIEKDIENAMIEKTKNLLLEFGKGFSFLGNQYKITTRNEDYYLDLLFYHIYLRCYVVVELKTD